MQVKILATEFMASYGSNRLRASTYRGYEVNIRKYIVPAIGEIHIESLDETDLDTLDKSMRILAPKSKIYVHATMRKMLNWAIKRKWINRNAYNQYDLPKPEEYKYQTLKEEEIQKILQKVKGDPLEIPITMALKYGMRRGEILGLQKSDLDATKRILHVQRTRGKENHEDVITPCKTKKSNRFILVDNETALLLMRQKNQICDLSPYQLNAKFTRFIEQNDLPKIRFHDLRHSYATYMLSEGVNPKIISNVLGHSRIETTLNIYCHPDVEEQSTCLFIWKNKKQS